MPKVRKVKAILSAVEVALWKTWHRLKEDKIEGTKAFLEKRTTVFKGK